MEIIGSIRVIKETQQVSASFRKRELVVTTEEQYPQHIMVEFVQDRTELLNNFKPGDKVKVSIDIRGREWTSPQGEVKYFNTINGWRIENMAGAQAQAPAAPAYGSQPQASQAVAPSSTPFPPAATNPFGGEEEESDLPF